MQAMRCHLRIGATPRASPAIMEAKRRRFLTNPGQLLVGHGQQTGVQVRLFYHHLSGCTINGAFQSSNGSYTRMLSIAQATNARTSDQAVVRANLLHQGLRLGVLFAEARRPFVMAKSANTVETRSRAENHANDETSIVI